MAEITGTLIIRNANAYVVDKARREIPLWAWLASFGLKDKEIEIELTRGEKNEMRIKRP